MNKQLTEWKKELEEETKKFEFGKLKQKPKATEEEVSKAIAENPIYAEAIEQYRGQIAYGIDKYPETLNLNTWTLVETLDHKISEMVDELNYTIMLKQQIQKLNDDLEKLFGWQK